MSVRLAKLPVLTGVPWVSPAMTRTLAASRPITVAATWVNAVSVDWPIGGTPV